MTACIRSVFSLLCFSMGLRCEDYFCQLLVSQVNRVSKPRPQIGLTGLHVQL